MSDHLFSIIFVGSLLCPFFASQCYKDVLNTLSSASYSFNELSDSHDSFPLYADDSQIFIPVQISVLCFMLRYCKHLNFKMLKSEHTIFQKPVLPLVFSISVTDNTSHLEV